MGKVALLAIAGFTVMAAVYGVGSQTQMFASQERITEFDYRTMARNAAVAGFTEAKQKLVESFTNQTLHDTYDSGEYSVNIRIDGANTASITSIGTMYDPDGSPVQHYIYAKVLREGTTVTTIPAEPPAWMQYALISERDLTLNGNVTIDTVRVVGSQGVIYNANIHTNGKITVNGAVTVRGFGTYKTSKQINPNQPQRFFKPYYNPTNDGVLKQLANGVLIPSATMDPAALNAKMAPDSTTGSVTLNGNIDFRLKGATRENPFIWYVDGNLTMNGSVKMTGYVIFLVRDDIVLNGNVVVQNGIGPSENTLGLYACRDIILSGTVDVLWGQIFAKRDFKMNGNPKINGNVVVGGLAVLNGTPDINYYPPSPALTGYWNAPPPATYVFKQITYSEKEGPRV